MRRNSRDLLVSGGLDAVLQHDADRLLGMGQLGHIAHHRASLIAQHRDIPLEHFTRIKLGLGHRLSSSRTMPPPAAARPIPPPSACSAASPAAGGPERCGDADHVELVGEVVRDADAPHCAVDCARAPAWCAAMSALACGCRGCAPGPWAGGTSRPIRRRTIQTYIAGTAAGERHDQRDQRDQNQEHLPGIGADIGGHLIGHAEARAHGGEVAQKDRQLARLVDGTRVPGDLELGIVGRREQAGAVEEHRVALLVDPLLGIADDGVRQQAHQRRVHVLAHHEDDGGGEQRDIVGGKSGLNSTAPLRSTTLVIAGKRLS